MRFQDKVVVVTGAAGGIGGAICQRFASEGALVVATDVNAEGVEMTAAGIRGAGGRGAWFCRRYWHSRGLPRGDCRCDGG